MDPLTASAAAALVMRYVVPAVKSLGARIWTRSEELAAEQTADAVVGFGQRLLQRLRGGQRDGAVQDTAVALREQDVVKRIDALAAQPDDGKTRTLAEGAIEGLLDADATLLDAVREMLSRAPEPALRQGDRGAVVGRDNLGVVSTGDNATITNVASR